jgi:ABC-type phosphate transport system substrate-binding protein
MNGWLRNPCLLLLCVFLWQSQGEAKTLAVVVNKSNATAGLSSADLNKVFAFTNQKWPDARKITLVVRNGSSPEMQMAIAKVLKIQPEEFQALLAAHRASVVLVDSEEALLKAVETIPGAIGLVDVYSINSRINVLKIDGKLPLEAGYLLRGN